MASTSNNHFISVSRDGVLMARRRGQRPVRVAEAQHGLEVQPPAEAVARGVPERLRVLFSHSGSRREVYVTDIIALDRRLDITAFQTEYGVSDEQLGGWMRAAVEAALEAAERDRRPW